MRVLFATDGSRSAALARDLIGSLPWPDDTRIRVVTVVEGRTLLPRFDSAIPDEPEIYDDAVARHVDLTLDDAVAALERPGRRVDRIVLEGRPASAVLDEGRGYGADLIVLGSHGHSRIATMLLGADTSAAARQAEAVVGWPTFRDVPASVVTVAPPYVPWVDALPGVMTTEAIEAEEYERQLALARAEAVARLAVDRLEHAGVQAEAYAIPGDAAAELVAFAMTRPHALLVVGSRAHGGLAKLLLGGVARNVLQHAAGSVLVVPETVPVPDEASARDAVGILGALSTLGLA